MFKEKTLISRRRIIGALTASGLAVGMLAASPVAAHATAGSAVPTGLFQLDASVGLLSMEAGADTNLDLNANIKLGLDRSISVYGGVIPPSQKFFALPFSAGTHVICSESVTTDGPVVPNLSCLNVAGESKDAGARIKLTAFHGRPEDRARFGESETLI